MTAMPAIDWTTYTDEAVDLLCSYIQIDTSNPPGRERLACEWLGDLLSHEGIPFELFDAGNDRWTLRAVLKGDGSKRPLMLLNHTDVVPVQREFWSEEPFAGLIKDGHIWGRGALDMKSLGIAQLMTFIAFKRNNVPLTRDLVFLAVADEEAGSEFGIHWMEEHHPDKLDCEYVLNEGGGGTTEMFGVARPVFNVAVAEKGPLWLKLIAEGRPGHASVPHSDNALDRLVRAMFRVQEWKRDMEVSDTLTEYFRRLKRAGIFKGEATLEGLTKEAEHDDRVRALLTNTISATMTSAGIKQNVIPAFAEAWLDCRLLPGVDPDEFQAKIASVIDDDKVRIERIYASSSGVNSFDTELFGVIEDVIKEHVEEAVVVPGITVGFTDSRVFRNRDVIAYGFSGGLTEPELGRGVHGHNERVGIESFRLNCQIVYEVVRRMCVPA